MAHQDGNYKEYGYGASMSWQPDRDRRGLSMTLRSSRGATASGVNALWGGVSFFRLPGRLRVMAIEAAVRLVLARLLVGRVPMRAGPAARPKPLPQPLLTWSGHAASWLEAGLPLHVARYEDLLAHPRAAFAAIVRFAGLGADAARLARAVDHARFDRLRAQEQACGFRERQPTAPSFFRAGRAGSWRDVLSPPLVRAIVDAHAPVMERFGYLHEAEEFLAAPAPGGAPGGAAGP